MNLNMDIGHLGFANTILDLLIQSIFLTTLKVHLIVQFIPEKFLMVLVNRVMDIEAPEILLLVTVVLLNLTIQ